MDDRAERPERTSLMEVLWGAPEAPFDDDVVAHDGGRGSTDPPAAELDDVREALETVLSGQVTLLQSDVESAVDVVERRPVARLDTIAGELSARADAARAEAQRGRAEQELRSGIERLTADLDVLRSAVADRPAQAAVEEQLAAVRAATAELASSVDAGRSALGSLRSEVAGYVGSALQALESRTPTQASLDERLAALQSATTHELDQLRTDAVTGAALAGLRSEVAAYVASALAALEARLPTRAVIEERLAAARAAASAELEQRIEVVDAQVVEALSAIAGLTTRNELGAIIAAGQSEVGGLRSELDQLRAGAVTGADLDALRSEVVAASAAVDERLALVTSAVEGGQGDVAALRSEIERIRAEAATALAALEAQLPARAALDERLTQLAASVETGQSEVAALRSELEQLRTAAAADVTKALADLEARLSTQAVLDEDVAAVRAVGGQVVARISELTSRADARDQVDETTARLAASVDAGRAEQAALQSQLGAVAGTVDALGAQVADRTGARDSRRAASLAQADLARRFQAAQAGVAKAAAGVAELEASGAGGAGVEALLAQLAGLRAVVAGLRREMADARSAG